MSAAQQLERASELVQAGKNEDARELLEQIIKEDRHNIPAWKLYAETWPGQKDKIRVWELCLRHNPSNPEAEQALALLLPNATKKSRTGGGSSIPVSQWLMWGSIALLTVVAAFAVFAARNATPKDPAEYRHDQPVEYYLYVPQKYSADQEWPLFVGIHGAGGTGLDCWNLWQSYADKEGFILLCPSIPGDASGFYQDVGENTVWSAIGEVQKEYRVKRRMFFSGFSAGAFFIQGFTYHYPDYVSGLSILSSGVYLNPNLFAQHVPMLVVIGNADDPTAVQTSQLFVSGLQNYGFDVQYIVMPNVGHTVTDEGRGATMELFKKTMGK
jgi:predicted esterase